MDVEALIQFAFDVGDSHHNSQVRPHILRSQLRRLAHQVWRSKSSTRGITPSDAKYTLAFEAIKVLREASARSFEIVTFYQHIARRRN